MRDWLGIESLLGNTVFEVGVGLIAAFTCYWAIKTARTPQGAVGWIVLVVFFPLWGFLLYGVFGFANYGKFEARRRATEAQVGEDALSSDAPPEPDDRLSVFAHLSGHRPLSGCHLDLLIDGQETYDTLIAAIDAAQDYVLVQYFIVADDHVGHRLREALEARARAGVKVWFLHDEFPLSGLPRKYWRSLREAGARTARPKGPARALGPFQLNYRNHRKIVVVDGRVGFTGGLNVGAKYMGEDPQMGPWRDTFARLKGPIVDQLQRSFAADWLWSTEEDITGEFFRDNDPRGDMRGLILAPSPTDPLNTGNLYFLALATQARHRLWITTPYFVPDSEALAALQLAALRGVDLRVLVPDRPDHYLTYWAAYAYFDDLRRAGGQIWRYEAGFTHQKVALVDDDVVSVGSINLDIRSGLLNFEVTAVMESKPLASQVEAMLEGDFARARLLETPLEEQPVPLRVAARVSKLVAPVL